MLRNSIPTPARPDPIANIFLETACQTANNTKQLQLKLELQNKEIASLNNEIEREKQLAQMQIQDVKERAETDIAHLKATLDAESSFQSSKLPDIISIFSFLFVS